MNLKGTMCENVDWIHLAQGRGTVEESCADGEEPSGSIKDGDFVDQQSDWLFLKRDTAACSHSYNSRHVVATTAYIVCVAFLN
jgi:hypothetical protein